jgi:hypothetical protein
LVPALNDFLVVVPDARLAHGVRLDCVRHLAGLIPPSPTLSVGPST